MNNKLFSFPLLVLFFFMACKKNDKNNSIPPGPVNISTTILTENLSFPWEIIWGHDGMIWMTERGGRISRVNPANGAVSSLLTITEVKSQGEGGLLGMALHPDFSTSPHVFVAYNYENGGDYREKVVRYTYNGTTLTSPQTIFDNINAAGIHNGCRLLIVNQKLFITTGDAADQSSPQNTSLVNGKILRLNLDGTIPADNPIPGNPVWSYGHRNAQGLVFSNGILYSSEHGPSSDDEINIIEKGKNFGWPDVKGFCNTGSEINFCTTNNVKEPIQAWSPTIAVCGLDYYNNDLIPGWKNSLLMCTLRGSRLVQLQLNDSHNAITTSGEYLNGAYGRLRDICISHDGKVYICTGNGNNDKILVIANGR
ncbi:MAG: PQQ-dependent sugar dehydrogenase [Chitinophagaceae bacterium]|nr:PQQ-dependent sugar dehydrogenase [Chitinophagaceae bacterium]